ncbi:MAG: SET domain-containing protein-lysine N-methyltransferase [Candidatus Daviesbacteria bacterium]|nr:SET domain-containing protein-lysine N-methyltransferase [Candidatus Daviesbacteria bacterium]
MTNIYPSTCIYLNKSKIPESGIGVFAAKDITKGDIIEVAPILVLEFTDFVETKWNLLFEYYFWMDDYVALALGFASMYNHSKDGNSKYELNRENKTIIFTAIKDIKKDTEIYFNYKGSSSAKAPLWFEKK